MSREYDLAIIGGGPGGYVAAIRAAQQGLKVALVEKNALGGTCLHAGCIPSKALLRSAEVYRQTKDATTYGIDIEQSSLNFPKVQKRKEQIVSQLHQGVRGLMNKNKIKVFKGTGRILGPSIFSPMAGTISIEHDNDTENTMIVPKNIIIATGSQPTVLEGLSVDGEKIITSEHALNMEQLPESIAIVGGGVIGIEWASMLRDFGVNVTVLEYEEEILPTEDGDIAAEVEKQLINRGVEFIKQASVQGKETKIADQVTITYKQADQANTLTVDQVLLAVGREANITDIGLSNTSVELESGMIQTNEFYQTKESHIYAIGDVIGNQQLAHVASHEGIIAVDHILGKDPYPIESKNIPACIYSYPEVATIGLTEQEAKVQEYSIKTGKFSFQANGKALVYGESEGFVKIIANAKNEDILGIHMVGPLVTELISEASLARLLDATPWELTESIHPHPTLSETIGEAALAIEGLQIHS